MQRILVGIFTLALLGAAMAGPPVDYELFCDEVDDASVIGVLSITEGKVHVALLADVACDTVIVAAPDGAPDVAVTLTADDEGLVVGVWIDTEPYAGELSVQVVPQVALDGMLTAQRLRHAAMTAAQANQERARERVEERREGTPPEDAPAYGAPGRGAPDEAPGPRGPNDEAPGPRGPIDEPPGDGDRCDEPPCDEPAGPRGPNEDPPGRRP